MASLRDTPMRYDSSAGELSSPPSGSLSEPGTPSRHPPTTERVGDEQRLQQQQQNPQQNQLPRQQLSQPQRRETPPHHHQLFLPHQQPPLVEQVTTAPSSNGGPQRRYGLVDGNWVPLTAAGVPRKKPGRKPGSGVKPRLAPDGSELKVRKPKARKLRDPEAAPVQRRRKLAPAEASDAEPGPEAAVHARAALAASSSATPGVFGGNPPGPLASGPPDAFSSAAASPPHLHASSAVPLSHQQQPQPSSEPLRYSPSVPRREGYPSSMKSILNADPPSTSPSQSFGGPSAPTHSRGLSYDPVRGNYDPVRETMAPHNPYSSTSGSPRGPSQMANRSPSIASMIEPTPSAHASPSQPHLGYQPVPTQSRYQAQDSSMPPSPSHPPKHTPTPAPASLPIIQEPKKEAPPPPPAQRVVIKDSNFTTIANGPIKRVSPKQNPNTDVSTPKTDNLDDMPQNGESRSILDFGRARPGDESQAPTIVLNVPLQSGETNKYVNFMRMAEDRYGWDALHPRLAANRDRKARIAAAAASLEKVESGRESGDEMSVDLSDPEGSNPENGGTSGADAQAKPKKKRNFKEDQYDVDDDFVDDSEMLWEAQAAASRDGFFVYSGPLVPEVEKPAASHEPTKRGRGRGSRGGRGSTRGTTTGSRGGGPGSRGGSITRKPRITKSEKAQREREKAERESMAQLNRTPTSGYVLQPTTPSFAVSELGA